MGPTRAPGENRLERPTSKLVEKGGGRHEGRWGPVSTVDGKSPSVLQKAIDSMRREELWHNQGISVLLRPSELSVARYNNTTTQGELGQEVMGGGGGQPRDACLTPPAFTWACQPNDASNAAARHPGEPPESIRSNHCSWPQHYTSGRPIKGLRRQSAGDEGPGTTSEPGGPSEPGPGPLGPGQRTSLKNNSEYMSPEKPGQVCEA